MIRIKNRTPVDHTDHDDPTPPDAAANGSNDEAAFTPIESDPRPRRRRRAPAKLVLRRSLLKPSRRR